VVTMLRLFISEGKRVLLGAVRYPVDTLTSVGVSTLVFCGILAGAIYFGEGSPLLQQKVDDLVIGYFAWLVAIAAIGAVASDVESDIKTGTLEYLAFISASSYRVYLPRAVAHVLLNLGLATCSLAVVLVLFGRSISLDGTTVLALTALSLGALGLGLVVGGLTLLFKRAGSLLAPVYLLVLPMTVIRFEDMGSLGAAFGAMAPIAPGAIALRIAGSGGDTERWLMIAAASSFIYFLVGSIVFSWADRAVRRRGNFADK
jgi:ABC-2 type transport system permease protein